MLALPNQGPTVNFKASFCLIVAIAVLGVGVLLLNHKNHEVVSQPYKYTEVDGCSVYRFDDEYGPNYFANCPSGNSAVTMSDGRHIPSFKAESIDL